MRLNTTVAADVYAAGRFDPKYFLDEGHTAFVRVSSGRWPVKSVGELFGANTIWMPNRFARVPAKTAQHGKPILVPYDCFRYLPYSNYVLSRPQVTLFSSLEVKPGWIMIVRSGRNLGPTIVIDQVLAEFVISDDMIRISTPPSSVGLYFAAFMQTPTGQALIRRDRNGSVIDHLSPEQVGSLRIPILPKQIWHFAVTAMGEIVALREKARILLRQLAKEFTDMTGLSTSALRESHAGELRRFSIGRDGLIDRFDVEPFAPAYGSTRKLIMGQRSAILSDLADVVRPPGDIRQFMFRTLILG